MEILKRLIESAEKLLSTPDYVRLKTGEDIDELRSSVNEAKLFIDVCNKVPTPLFDRVIVRPIEPENIQGGVIMPDNDNQHYGILISKGDMVSDKVNVDEIVFWTGEMGETLTVEGEDFILAPYKELKGVIK